MITIRWMTGLLLVECLICLFFITDDAWSTALALLFFLLFLIFGWTFREPRTNSDSRKASS